MKLLLRHRNYKITNKRANGWGSYNEEYARISNELESLRQDKSKIETANLSIEQYKERVDEIIKVIKEQEGLLTEFDDKIFNALVDRIEIL